MQDSLFPIPVGSAPEYKVLARKYRPKNFNELIGQRIMVETLKNSIEQNRLHHAYILTGTRGIGKTTTARIIAKALNCAQLSAEFEPCSTCSSCVAIARDQHQDVIEIDAASNTGVDNIREIIESSAFKPINAKYKVFIIDEVHMLSKSAFNALLKTLEEPPPHIKFIFATTELRKIPITIISRCQKFDLRKISIQELQQHFANVCRSEGVTWEESALLQLASSAKGSVRDGLSMLDQAIALAKDNNVTTEIVEKMLGSSDISLTIHLIDSIINAEIEESLKTVDKLYQHGADPLVIAEDIAKIFHNLARYKILNNPNVALSEEEGEFIKSRSSQLDLIFLTRGWQLLQKGMQDIGHSHFPHEELEMLVIKLHIINAERTPEDILKAINSGSVEGKGHSAPTSSPSTTSAQPTNLAVEVKPLNKDFDFSVFVQNALKAGELMLYHSLYHNVSFKALENDILHLYDLGVDRDFTRNLGQFVKERGIANQVEFHDKIEGCLALGEVKTLEDKRLKEEVLNGPLVQTILAEHEGSYVVN